jgi:predicted Zn-dependent peptidase
MDIVKNCSQQLVRSFYERWYQPQNQAVVVVGDFDSDQMVAKVKKMFGDRKRGKNVSPVPPTIPDSETKILLYPEKQQPLASLAYMIRLPKDSAKQYTVGSMKTDILRDEIRVAIEKKLKSLKTKYPELIDGSVMTADVADLSDKLWILNLSAPQDQWRRTLELLAKQVELIRRKGFGDDYWKQGYYHPWPQYNADSTAIVFVDTLMAKNPTPISTQYVNKYIANFFKGDAIIADMEKQLVDRHIRNTINADEIREEFCRMTSGRNMLIGVMLPDSALLPNREEVETLCQRVRNMSDEELAEVEVAQAKKLDRINVEDIDIPTVPGTVVKTKVLNDSISEVLLSNGIKVVLMKQPTEHHLIHFMIRRPQGFSMLNDDDIHYHDMLGSSLRKFRCYNGETTVSVEAFDDTYDHTAKWEPDDKLNKFRVESTLKMLYKSLTTDEIDSVEFAEQKQRLQASAVTLSTPTAKAALKVGLMTAVDAKRLMPPSVETVADYNIDHFREIVQDYFSNYNGSVMLVQGEVEADSIMPLILKYVGALPSKPERVKRITWPADHYKTENTVMTEKIENPTPICQTLLFYTWEKGFEYTLQSHAHNEVLKSVLGNLLMQTLRVQHSDVYTPQVQMEDALLPVPHLKYTITYACNPTQRERIAEDVKRIVQDMAEGDLITQDLIDGYVKSREKQQEAYKGNEYTKRRDYLTQELNGIVVKDGDLTYIRQVTPKSLKDHVKQLLKKGNLHVGYLTTE